MPVDFYDVLDVSRDASEDELKRAYRAKVREYHPDVNDEENADDKFKLVRKAHEVLSDPAERKDYDRLGHREYVEKRMGNLPPLSVFGEESAPSASTGQEAGDKSRSSTGERAASESAEGSPSSDTGASGTGTATSTATSTATNSGTNTSTSTGTGGSSRETSNTGSTGSRDTRGRSTRTESATGTTSNESESAWDDVIESEKKRQGTPTSPAGRRRRTGLRRWYGVVALALVAYLAGVGVFLSTALPAVRSFVSTLATAPTTALSGPARIPSPRTFVEQLVVSPSPTVELLFPAGVVLLPLTLLIAVARHGRATAWLYVLGSLAPVTILAAWSVLPGAAWVVVVGLLLLPLLGAFGFLIDVGLYLWATR